jgi:hypothetical protein
MKTHLPIKLRTSSGTRQAQGTLKENLFGSERGYQRAIRVAAENLDTGVQKYSATFGQNRKRSI